MKKYIVNSHGELLDELGPGDRILRAKSVEYLKSNFESGAFVKGSVDELRLVMPELNIGEKSFILSIVPYIGYDDCKLRWPNTAHDIRMEHLTNIVGCSKSGLYRVTKSLRDKKILHGKFYMNPWLFFRGNKIDPRLIRWFGEYKIRSLGGVAWREL